MLNWSAFASPKITNTDHTVTNALLSDGQSDAFIIKVVAANPPLKTNFNTELQTASIHTGVLQPVDRK